MQDPYVETSLWGSHSIPPVDVPERPKKIKTVSMKCNLKTSRPSTVMQFFYWILGHL
jgi:hypothetical protein